MKTTRSALACAILCRTLCNAQQPATAAGVISGTVKGSDGTAIASGLISASLIAGPVRSRMERRSATVSLAAGGTFRLPPLAMGTYRICVQAGTPWLNSCEWGQTPLTVIVSPTQPSAIVSVALMKGALIPIRVIDPGRALSASEGKVAGAHLLVGITTDAHFFRTAALVSEDGAGRNYQILIPFDRTINISVASGFYQLANAAGAPLARSNRIPVVAASGHQPPTLVLRVNGVLGHP